MSTTEEAFSLKENEPMIMIAAEDEAEDEAKAEAEAVVD